MGIPSYFSYIIKNHRNIVKRLSNAPIHRLCLDSNSIIYDVARSLKNPTNTTIIQGVCQRIQSYIDQVKPLKETYISFDGVPPLAKANQQRERRYKGWVTHQLLQDTIEWNTVQITPGTDFMNQLDKELVKYFKGKPCVVSTSQEAGEGEHKIMDYLKRIAHDERVIVYGLDADLIILGMLQPVHIELMRESPDFINVSSYTDKLLLLDLPQLRNTIEESMSIYDYVFMSMLLGNDFMPHFPSLQIRMNGMDVLMDTYKSLFSKGMNLYDGKVNWVNVRKLIQTLTIHEQKRIQENDKIRDKARRDRKDINDIPIMSREVEKYINPYEPYWEDRYYSTLFHSEPTHAFRKQVSNAYVNMLVWNIQYYTSGCKDWEMYYPYGYAPLLKDLVHHLPNDTKITYAPTTPLTPNQLLAYVMPEPYHTYLPKEIQMKVKDNPWYSRHFPLEWAYCKYFWESHVKFPTIPLDEIKKL